jgi:hypothetical protein
MDEITRELQAKLDAAVAQTAGAAWASAQRVAADSVAAARAATADSLDPVLERSQARVRLRAGSQGSLRCACAADAGGVGSAAHGHAQNAPSLSLTLRVRVCGLLRALALQELLSTARAHYATSEEVALSRVRGARAARGACQSVRCAQKTLLASETLVRVPPSLPHAEGVHAAVEHPAAALAVGGSLLLLALPPSRRALYAATIGRVRSADSQAASAARRTAGLREALDAQAKELGKLTERVGLAQEEYARGRSKLMAAGSQLRSLAASARKVEDKTAMLLDDLRHMRHLPQAAELRSAASAAASLAAKQRSAAEKHMRKVACQVPV